MTAVPRVSVLLPNYNNRHFLEEQMRSITGQTFRDWELIVYDGHSDDGSWEFFSECAAADPRIRLYQGPREGVYAAWNSCLSARAGRVRGPAGGCGLMDAF
jgi:glycosyltransferase involved in cell wall biosynthesis